MTKLKKFFTKHRLIICLGIIIAFIIGMIIGHNLTNITRIIVYRQKDKETIKNKYEYDCTYTRTYHVVDLLKNYQAEVPEVSFIIVDQFQDARPRVLELPTTLKSQIKVGKYYEITYHLQGPSDHVITDDEYALTSVYIADYDGKSTLENDFSIIIDNIKETHRTGLDQINESVCSYNKVD